MANDPVIEVFIAYKAFIAERTGLSWEQIEKWFIADAEFWSERPIAAEHLREFLNGR